MRPENAAGALPKGRSVFRDSHPALREAQPRIYVKFRLAGVNASFWALLDTGSHFCLLNEDVAALVQGRLTEKLDSFTVRTANGLVTGPLYRYQITLVADFGESLDLDGTVFVPPGWKAPCFLGYCGLLDHTMFAVNPRDNLFFFGAP